MSLNCPKCQSVGALKIIQSIELPPDVRSDEISFQLLACSNDSCGFQGVAIYEESRRGALDSDHWDHTGYRVSDEIFEKLKTTFAQCPDPANASCQCESHQELGNVSPAGSVRWQPPEGIEWGSAFPIDIG